MEAAGKAEGSVESKCVEVSESPTTHKLESSVQSDGSNAKNVSESFFEVHPVCGSSGNTREA